MPRDRPAAPRPRRAGNQLYIDRLGRYCREDGTPTGWMESPEEARRLWADHPRDRGEELADLIKDLGLDRP